MKTTVAILLSLLLLASCTSPSSEDVVLEPDVGEDQLADVRLPLETVVGPDLAAETPGADIRESVGDTVATEVAPADTFGPACQPGEGCFLDKCSLNAQCQSGWCVEHMGEGVCSRLCQDECPAGWSCKQIAGTEPDVVFICVSDFTNLCRPCATGNECKSTVGAEDVCLDYGEEGSFCGGPCVEDDDCPWGFHCQEAQTVDGIALNQCVAEAGICPCTSKSVALALWTPCERSNEAGACAGKRVCTEDGLSPCDAPTPQAELCDGDDDDCDGDVDEVPCDDDNLCTEDACKGLGGCEFLPLDGGECLDGNPCTAADHCVLGLCVGDPVDCDDEDPCTDDSCDGKGGCVHVPNTAKCDDEDPCTVADQCADGACIGVAVSCECQADKDCAAFEDGDVCNGTLKCDTASLPYQCKVKPGTQLSCPAAAEGPDSLCLKPACDPATGDCSLLPDHEGYPCDDGDPCNLGDICQGGTCVAGTPVNCNDGELCTDDLCDPAVGCQHVANSAPCNDGNACTAADVCAGGKCSPGQVLSCDDGNACNGKETCDPAKGCVLGLPLSCDDGNACNGMEACDPAKGCGAGIPLACDDGNACNGKETCDPAKGCVGAAALSCDDGDLCNGLEICTPAKGCQAGPAPSCDDGNACTDDLCEKKLGCLHSNNAAACDDGSPCTAGDHCAGGKCVFSAMDDCDDGKLCTDDSCDPALGCIHTLNTAPCDDGDICTTGDHCHLGACTGGGQLACKDGNPCTDDQCVPKAGCEFLPNGKGCDDGSACTTGDHCDAGMCVVSGLLDCADGNVCTDDSCDGKLGCLHVANAKPCDDGTVCTVGDVCLAKACQPGQALDCDDGNLCTDDACDVKLGCGHGPNTLPCNDNNLCTPFDKCQGGQCVGAGAVDCNDKNICTDDSCVPADGCLNQPNSNPCDDANACTTLDVCSAGKCVGGAAPNCDDSNACTTDACAPQSGCTHTPLPNGTACGGGKTCQDGKCGPLCTPGSQTFNFTGAAQSFVVPGGCTTLQVEALGAQGGCGEGGKGGRARGTLTVTPAETVQVYVGGAGGCDTHAKPGGFNGGGATVTPSGDNWINGDGGGASDVRRGGLGLEHRVIVAGGGGGRGWGGTGGAGGGATGADGNPSGGGCNDTCAGKGGKQGAGGDGGYCGPGCIGNPGTLGKGGTGAACAACGGGGGGGYYGGGGGAHCAAGGGSSYFGPGVQKQEDQQGTNSGHGKIVISWP
jgi:hypothetical protein